MHDVSSSVFSSKSGKLPQSNTFTPGGKEVRQKKKKNIFLDGVLIFKLLKCLFSVKVSTLIAKTGKSQSSYI